MKSNLQLVCPGFMQFAHTCMHKAELRSKRWPISVRGRQISTEGHFLNNVAVYILFQFEVLQKAL